MNNYGYGYGSGGEDLGIESWKDPKNWWPNIKIILTTILVAAVYCLVVGGFAAILGLLN